ncbi:Protein xmas-2 [Frankliniella fusca]|uniref:Protein xmas-2 n=1 Tax=Frankliniella fusca TaxID=407009 RepID=A0AAE1LVA7_9NEOP|nr:Protein xmas-2 [Frankliniella fusca]
MGEPHPFGLPFQQLNSSGSDPPNSSNSQESSVNQNLFATTGLKSVFGSPAPNGSSSFPKSNIFGGSAFSKHSDSAFPASGTPNIFGGSSQPISSQPLQFPKPEDQPQLSGFGKSSTFGEAPFKSDLTQPGTNNAFGGVFGTSQASTTMVNPFSNSTSQSKETASSSKGSIFGGAFSKKEDSAQNSGVPPSVSAVDVSFDKTRSVYKNTLNKVSSPPETSFGKLSSSEIVSSSLSKNLEFTQQSDKREGFTQNPDLRHNRNMEPDSIGEENQKQLSGQLPDATRTKINRKPSVFGRAILDATKSSDRKQPVEESRSIICHPLNGDLADVAVFKKHFSKFGSSHVTMSKSKEKPYCIATYKSHKDAAAAFRGSKFINGVKYKIFWRNVTKVRRKSSEEVKSPDQQKKLSRRSEMEIDSSVQEELEAISGMDSYDFPSEAASKRKAGVEPDSRRKSRLKTVGLELEAHEGRSEINESVKRNSSTTSGSEITKEQKSRVSQAQRASRADEKSGIRGRISGTERTSSKRTEEVDEMKQEKAESNISETATASTAAMSELLEILKHQAVSTEEKLRVLDARDKLMRLRQVKQYDLSKAVKTVGTCPDMCPEKERLLRESRRQISQYETLPSKPNEMVPSLMVKQYSRSSADQEEPLPHELRPPTVLTMTMNYLMHNIMNLGDQPGENLGEWYHFLWDRLRGIRKEITQQELCDLDAVRLVEQCARFHIHCGARLVAEDMSVFDDRINTENLTKCLQTLKHMYHDLWTNNSITCKTEPEFVTYFLLLNLNNGTIMWEMEQLREEVLKSPEIGFVATMYNSLSSNNYVRFFRLVKKASYLNSCLCIRYFYQVRAKALRTYVKALAKFRPVQYPLSSLIDDLGFENFEQAAAFCSHYGLIVENVSLNSACVVLSQETFENPSFVLPSERAFRMVESKKTGSVGEVVNGAPLPPRSFEKHIPHDSFDKNGFLTRDAFYAKDQGVPDLEVKPSEGDITNIKEARSQYTDKELVKVVQPLLEDAKSLPESGQTFGSNQKSSFPSTFSSHSSSNMGTGFGMSQSPIFPSTFGEPHSELPQTVKLNAASVAPSSLESIKHTVFQTPVYQTTFVDEAKAKIEAEKKAEAELKALIEEKSDFFLEDVLQSSVLEAVTDIVVLEWKSAEDEQKRAEEARRAEEQLRAQEELRKRILFSHIDRVSDESLSELLHDVVAQLITETALESYSDEEDLVRQIMFVTEESFSALINLVTEEMCDDIASEELKRSQDVARKEAVQCRVKQVFYLWLQKARRSLHRRQVMEDFPASVIPLSIKEHAERWGFSENVDVSASKREEKLIDFSDIKTISAHPQTTFAELIGVQAVHRYDSVRSQLGLRPTDKLLYKLFVSVPDKVHDPATHILDWWTRRVFKQQKSSMLVDDCDLGVYRLVSGLKVTSEIAVYASLQTVRGSYSLEKSNSLVSGTSAVLFALSPVSNIEESRSRLTKLFASAHKLPAFPLVVAVVSPSEPPLEGLKQLVLELELDRWLTSRVISDYQILHVEELLDIKYLSDRFNLAFNYMAMTWTPISEFSLVCLKNVLRSTFQMFYISIQFNYNSSEVYPQDIDNPNVIIGLCNEWLSHMCHEFVTSFEEAKDLCAEEFWPLLHKGAFLPFLKLPNYSQVLQEMIKSVCLPAIEWPLPTEDICNNVLSEYCSWLRPDEHKQTLRRLSCLNGLNWPEKVKAFPWINLIEDWMEARINYMDSSRHGGEMLCLMRAQNVENLYTFPWWAQSEHILSYLEMNGSGRECEMDVDQTVPSEETGEENISSEREGESNGLTLGFDQLEEVADSVNELKSVNESLLNRIRKALADDTENELAGKTPSDEIKTVKNNGSTSQSTATPVAAASQANAADSTVDGSTESSKKSASSCKVIDISENPHLSSQAKMSGSSKSMEEIMASVNDIVSSLNLKYNILESESKYENISDLRLGAGKTLEVAPVLSSDKVLSSSFVEQSQKRMQERLFGKVEENVVSSNDSKENDNDDSDLEIIANDDRSSSTVMRTVSSPSISESGSFRSDSDSGREDFRDERASYCSNDRSRKHQRRNRSESNSSDSESHRRQFNSMKRKKHVESDEDDQTSHKKQYDSDVSDSASNHSYQNSEDDISGEEEEEGYAEEEEEVQAISSDDSQEPETSPVKEDSNGEPPCLLDENPFSILPVANLAESVVPQNGLDTEEDLGSERNLVNLDNMSNPYGYYGQDAGVDHEPLYSECSDINAVQSSSCEMVMINNDVEPTADDNNHILLSGYDTALNSSVNEVEVEVGRDEGDMSNQSILDHSEGTLVSSSEDGGHDSEHGYSESEHGDEEEDFIGEAEEEEEDYAREAEEEEDYAGEAEEEEDYAGEAEEEEDFRAEEEALGEEEGEEEGDENEFESDAESVPDEDSDICEIIEDD